MLRPPPISDLPRYPVTGVTAVLAIAATIAWFNNKQLVDSLEINYLAFHGQPWRLVTSTLPHVDIFHIAFNLYWLWTFGTLVEHVFGSIKTAGIYLLLAVGSSAAEYAVMSGGVGLSGVGYGLFGLIWVLSRHDRRFKETIDSQTINLFIGWFFLCIVLTYTGMMRVGNVAHGSGAVLGAALGFVIAFRKSLRVAMAAGLMLVLGVIFWGATVGRPRVNFSPDGGYEEAKLAYEALLRNDNQQAVHLLTLATSMRHPQAAWWYNLGVAYRRLNQNAGARAAFAKAVAEDPSTLQYKTALVETPDPGAE